MHQKIMCRPEHFTRDSPSALTARPEDNKCLRDADSAERQVKTKYHNHKQVCPKKGPKHTPDTEGSYKDAPSRFAICHPSIRGHCLGLTLRLALRGGECVTSNLQMSSHNSGLHQPRVPCSSRSTGLNLGRPVLAVLALENAPVREALTVRSFYGCTRDETRRSRATSVPGGPKMYGEVMTSPISSSRMAR